MKQKEKKVTIQVLGKSITAQITQLDNGIAVLLTGGEQSHIGAVAYVGGEQKNFCLSGHREEELSQEWAKQLWRVTGKPVCVACGIHYDNLSRAGIEQVLEACKKLLEQVIEQLEVKE